MAFDFRKNQKSLYLPGQSPCTVDVPWMKFFMVDGTGDPNSENSSFQAAMDALYSLSYTIRMSQKAGMALDGFFEYTVPPLEGLWRMDDDMPGIDYSRKRDFRWTVMIRQPDFVDDAAFRWASGVVLAKKKADPSLARLEEWTEGLCVQCMHLGSYDDEPATLSRIHDYMAKSGLAADMDGGRRHHEIYLSNPQRVEPQARKTVLRIPVRRQ